MNNFFINKQILKNIAWLLVGAMFFIGDRLLKDLAIKQEISTNINLITNLLTFHFTLNPYIAFSLPISGIILNILITLIVIGLFLVIIYLILVKKGQNSLLPYLTFILFGAISNLLDRYQLGGVIDYFNLKYFTIFNIADVMISIGIFFVFIKTIKNDKKNNR